jgi:hypothetical protein
MRLQRYLCEDIFETIKDLPSFNLLVKFEQEYSESMTHSFSKSVHKFLTRFSLIKVLSTSINCYLEDLEMSNIEKARTLGSVAVVILSQEV